MLLILLYWVFRALKKGRKPVKTSEEEVNLTSEIESEKDMMGDGDLKERKSLEQASGTHGVGYK